MSQQGVSPQLIQNYVRTSGMARPLAAADITYLHNAGVQDDVINVMMNSPGPQAQQAPVIVQQPTPVIVQERYYDPWYGPHYHYYHGPRYCGPPGPRVSWGVSVMR